MSTEVFSNGAQTTLSSGITNVATSLSVASASLFPTTGNFRILVESEIMWVTAVSGTTFTVTRGAEGSTAVAHSAGVSVIHIVTAAVLQALPPTGAILDYAGYTAPTGYYLCDGSAQSRTTDAALYDAITLQLAGTTTSGSASVTGISSTANLYVGMPVEGTGIAAATTIATIASGTSITLSANATASGSPTLRFYAWGNGDGSTTFNLPTAPGRVFVTAGAGSGLTSRVMGQSGGEETHLLTTAEMPAHTHGQTINVAAGVSGSTFPNASQTNLSADNRQTQSTGGGSAHNNMQPYLVMNRIIKR